MKILFKLLMVLLVIAVAGCGSHNPDRDSSDAYTPGQSLVLTTSLGQDELLAMRGSTTIVAVVNGTDGKPVIDGTQVTFTASSGTITPTAFTVQGRATATYFADNSGGRVVVTATSGSLVAETLLTVATGSTAAIAIKSITPDRLGLKGSGFNETGSIVFYVTDSAGNPVADGQPVNFDLEQKVGDELVYPTFATTLGGEVTANVVSGAVPGVIKVIASIENIETEEIIATEARITMGYGEPHEKGLGLSFEKLNLPGLVMTGVENTLTVSVADRYSNPVPAGTPVYFASNCGIVALADADGVATNLTNQFGFASVKLFTGAPHPPAGLCTYLAWTRGEGASKGEPFIDANGDGIFNLGETYFDLDGNGRYTTAADYSDDLNNTYVWQSARIRWSGMAKAPVISPSSFVLSSGSVQPFNITVADVNGGPLPGGSSFTVTKTGCDAVTLTGDATVEIPDAVLAGAGTTDFKVNLLAPASITTSESCSITVAVTTEISGNPQSTVVGRTLDSNATIATFSGTGTPSPYVTTPFRLPAPASIAFNMSYSGTSDFTVELINALDDNVLGTLINQTGSYLDTVDWQITIQDEYRLRIQADDNWTITVRTN